jgi:modulator of FtsH protease
MNPTEFTTFQAQASSISANKVIKNTYMLLSLTLLFSACTAALSLVLKMPGWTYLAAAIGAMLLMWLVLPRTAQSAAGIGVVFAVTGLLGFGLGPLLGFYLHLPKGPEIVGTAMGGTGVIFLGLSAYALTTRKDFSFMGGFLFAGMLVVMMAILANIFLAMPLLSVTVSAAMILLMSGFILYDTSDMIHGGETNYLLATVRLYLNIYNIFIHLLSLLGILSNDE